MIASYFNFRSQFIHTYNTEIEKTPKYKNYIEMKLLKYNIKPL